MSLILLPGGGFMPDLKLYYFESCPFCQKVLKYLKRKDLLGQVLLKNTKEDKLAREELIKIGGKYQVPCLFIGDKPLYESNEIIRWFKNREKQD